MRAHALLAAFALGSAGCWKTRFADVPTDASIAFTPELEAPPGWTVLPIPVNLECPTGEDTRFHLLYPETEVGGGPLPVAVLYHSGAFDFVYAPTPGEPVGGTHFATPGRLDEGWAIRHVFATLGLLANEVELETHLGALPVAFAEQGVAVLLPANCWGDLWHNRRGLADNDFPSDLFARDGRTAAEWAYQFATDPAFAAAFGVELPVLIDPDQVFVVGLGVGGRAVGELLSIDADEDGVPDHRPAGALVDSHFDDLRVFYDDPAGHGNVLAGLDRIFPLGRESTVRGSLYAAALPPRFGYLYAEGDPLVPTETHRALVRRLTDTPGAWLHIDPSPLHVLLNADLALARDAVRYLLEGVVPDDGGNGPMPTTPTDTGTY